MIEHDPVVLEYEHEKFRPREAEALQTLRKVASLVKPVMRQRGWRVGVLTEFWPPEKNLLGLNWNKGQKICLRLRYPFDEKQFLPLDEVVDTMLHELCHIVHGPHDEPFHTLWNQLRSEHEQLLRKGYTGEGFLSKGHKLGGSDRIPMHEARRRAHVAADKRRALTSGSGQKLGGAPIARGQDIRRVIADAAARRATVTKGCASGTDRSRGFVEETAKNGFRTKADEEDADEEAIMMAYIDLIQEEEKERYGDRYIPPSKENPAGSQGMSSASKTRNTGQEPPPIPNLGKPIIPPSEKNPTSSQEGRSSTSQPRNPNNQEPPPAPNSTRPIDLTSDPPVPNPNFWACDICTLVNPSVYLCCDACGTERPESSFPSFQNPTSTPTSFRPTPTPTPTSSRPKPTPASRPQPRTGGSGGSGSSSTPPWDSKPKPKPNSSIQSLVALTRAAETRPAKPLGWLCYRCHTWMESEWWTCALCGAMKLES